MLEQKLKDVVEISENKIKIQSIKNCVDNHATLTGQRKFRSHLTNVTQTNTYIANHESPNAT